MVYSYLKVMTCNYSFRLVRLLAELTLHFEIRTNHSVIVPSALFVSQIGRVSASFFLPTAELNGERAVYNVCKMFASDVNTKK